MKMSQSTAKRLGPIYWEESLSGFLRLARVTVEMPGVPVLRQHPERKQEECYPTRLTRGTNTIVINVFPVEPGVRGVFEWFRVCLRVKNFDRFRDFAREEGMSMSDTVAEWAAYRAIRVQLVAFFTLDERRAIEADWPSP